MRFLSRSAEGLYWMSRYLERAEHLCRLLRHQVEVLVDRPTREIDFGWSRIYLSVERQPPGAPLEASRSDAYALADAYTLADDLTFEPSNPESVWSCLAMGRENARQMRHCISEEMWLCLNRTYLQLKPMGLVDVWRESPQNFYLDTAQALRTFASVAEMSMYRDQRWHFMQLGRLVERAQLMLRLLRAQLRAAAQTEEDWVGLLLRYHAFEAYQQRHSVEVSANNVLDLLALDESLPASLCRLVDNVLAHVMALPPAAEPITGATLRQTAERLCAGVRLEWSRQEDRGQTIERALGECQQLHALVASAYF